MESKSRKTCMANVTKDGKFRINDLQDDVLRHILSCLPIEARVRACFVSKRWESLWSPLSVVDIDYERFCRNRKNLRREEKRKRFSAFVEYTLSKTWESCTVLKLDHFQFDPLKYGVFKSLHTIVFKEVRMPVASLHKLVKKCPILEELHLIQCSLPSGNGQLFLDAPKTLKCLVLEFPCGYDGKIAEVIISAPYVVKFKFAGDMLENFHVGKLPNLVEGEILFSGENNSPQLYIMIHNLLGSFTEARTLSLSRKFFQLLNTYADEHSELAEDAQHTFRNLKNLTLHSSLGDWELMGVHRFLRSSPHIETLTVVHCPGGFYADKFWEKQLVPFTFFNHLKKLEIKSFYGLDTEMEFLKYMLGNALVLKKMVICKAEWQDPCTASESDEDDEPDENLQRSFQDFQEKAIGKVLSFRRASPDIEILLP